MLPRSLRKLLHQHLIDLLHSQKAIVVSILTLILLIVSIIQFSDTVLEWSIDKYRIVQHRYSTSDNLLGIPFEKQLSYNGPIDVVYTWVNGSDPWHQKQLRLYKDVNSVIKAKPNQENGENEDKSTEAGHCDSAYCVQARAVLITPTMSLSDLSEVLNDLPQNLITRYDLPNQTLSLTSESFDLDDLLEERFLLVNDHQFSFHSVHLTAYSGNSVFFPCRHVEFARMLLDVGGDITREDVERAFPASLRLGLRTVDFYRIKDVVLIYFSSELTNLKDLAAIRSVELGGRPVDVAQVCLLEDIRPSSSDNEMRLSRFQDNEELRYSIRSLVKHAGWIRRIIIVTNGQVPYWLNLEHPKVEIVTHEDIFTNKSHLPTFSSSAIESHLHRIPGLSEKFLYLNDDVLFGRDILPEDLYSHSEGYQVHLSWNVPACAEGCPSGWIRDGFCDATCNNAMCNFDGGDCSNRTTGLDMDDDKFSELDDLLFTGPCRPGCLQAWLADRYCDVVCNHPECGFDAGDCGLEKLTRFPHILLSESETEYSTPVGASVIVLNASAIFSEKNVTLKDGTFRQAKGVRVVSVYPQRQTIVFLLHSNATGSTTFTLNYVKNASPANETTEFEFLVHFNSSPTATSETPETAEVVGVFSGDVTFAPIPAELKGPNAVFDESRFLQRDANLTMDQLVEMFHDGDLTEYGFERRKAALLGIPLNSSFTPASSPPTTVSTPAKRSTVSARSQSSEKPTSTRSFRKSTVAPYGRSRKVGSKGMQYKDAYAESLRHVNRLYNEAFGIKPRKVPAHIPHFVDRGVMQELQEKFRMEFDLTSGTRVRSPRDMQFAFSFFHYIMDVQESVQMETIFEEIDIDHSKSWNEREINLAAVRSSENDLSEGQLLAFRATVELCAKNASADNEETVSVAQSAGSRLEIPKQVILTCDAVRMALLTQYGKRNRFKFRVTTDSEAFTFIRVGNNITQVRKQLQAILRHPRKFICLNDEVDYTRADSFVVQTAIRDFFETLYPLPSPFELPVGVRGQFSQYADYRSLTNTYNLFRAAVFCSGVIILLMFSCILFPRRRRLLFRRIRLWMRNRDTDHALILHT